MKTIRVPKDNRVHVYVPREQCVRLMRWIAETQNADVIVEVSGSSGRAYQWAIDLLLGQSKAQGAEQWRLTTAAP